MQDDEYGEIVDLNKDINLLETKFNMIQTIVKLLEFFPVPSLIEEVSPELDQLLGFPVPLDPTDKITYAHSREGALGHGTRYWSEAQAMRTQLPAPDPAGVTKITREYFDQVIVALSQYNKFKISKHDTTVGEFTAMIQDMRRGIAAARKIQQN